MNRLETLIREVTVFDSGSICYDFITLAESKEDMDIVFQLENDDYLNKNFDMYKINGGKRYLPKKYLTYNEDVKLGLEENEKNK